MKKIKIGCYAFLSLIVSIIAVGSIQYVWAMLPSAASGWGWGGTPSIDGAYSGMGWISFSDSNTGSGGGTYAVEIPVTSGPLSGFAWSSHYGWISFNAADLAGCVPALSAPTRAGNNITGGARIISMRDAGANAGGYTGCISLSGSVAGGLGYGVFVSGGNLSGYAWSSDLGWIDMSRVLMPPLVDLTVAGCVVPPGQSTCYGRIGWTFYNVPSPEDYLVENSTTNAWSNTSESSGGFIPILLQFGQNTITASANRVFNQVVTEATCDTVWYSGICFPSPSITLTVTERLIRSGGQAEINVTVNDFPYPLECEIVGATPTPINFTHSGVPATATYSHTTMNLTSTQIIAASCTHIATGLSNTGEVRVNVIPAIQET